LGPATVSLSPEQIATRRRGVFASEIAAIKGLSLWSSAWDVWLNKVHPELVEPFDSLPADIGNAVEPVALARYARSTGRTLGHFGTIIHPRYPEIGATPDAVVFGERLGVEAKWAGAHTACDWTEDDDGIPDYYRPQVEMCMEVCGVDRWDVAAIVDGELWIYEIHRDPALAKHLVDVARAFWADHVLTGIPPAVTRPASYGRALQRQYPQGSGAMLPASPVASGILTHLRAAKADAKQAKHRVEMLGNELKALIGDADGIDGIATWKLTKDAHVAAHTRKGTRMLRLIGEEEQ
jgi:putative phage-type endonuclease